MKVRIARHGQPAISGLKPGMNYQFPPTDCGLTALGRIQAEYLGRYLRRCGDCGRIISSPYARTLETAAVISQECGQTFYLDARIQEARFYPEPPCPGMTLEEIRRAFPQLAEDACLEWPWMTPGGVEENDHIRQRLEDFTRSVLPLLKSSNILVVGHGASVEGLKHIFSEMSGTVLEDRENWNCSLSEFELTAEGRWRTNFISRFDFIPPQYVSSNLEMFQTVQHGEENDL